MRDLLTALAGAVILILVAALAVPPLIAWEGQRALVDQAIGRSLGLAARSEGRIDVRLLPSPRLRLDRLHLGDDPAKPGLDLHFVKAEIGLTPLLSGDVRFTETRIGRAEVKLPVADGDAILLPENLGEVMARRELAVEDLRIAQFLLTTVTPATGRTDQIRADGVHLAAPKLAGPWRMEGTSAGIPFRVATSAPTEEGVVTLKVSGGGDTQPRFEADARISFAASEPGGERLGGGLRSVVPEAEGSARIVVGPPVQVAGVVLPFSLGGKFKARGPLARFDEVSAEVDPGGQAVRLSGTGRIDLRTWRAALSLEARRLDLDAFLTSSEGQALIARGLPAAGTGLPVMVDLDLSVDSLALGLDDWSDLAFAGTFDRTGGLVLRRFSVVAPGAATLAAAGEIDTQPTARFTGNLTLDAPASDGIGRYLRRFGLEGPAIAVMDGRPIQLATDVAAASPTLSLRNLRLSLGEARITGNARYTRGEGTGRGRFDAQVAAQGIDVATLPSFSGALAELQGHDLGLTIQARDVRYGPARAHSGNGTIAASIQSDGASLVVDSLDVTDLAGANAKLSGRIAPDGAGRIAGRVTAPVAAPLLALLDRVWIAEARLAPDFLRAGSLDLDVTLERESGAADTLRTAAKGTASGGGLDLALLSRGSRIESLDLMIGTPRAGRWFAREDIPGLRAPGTLTITGRRPSPGADGGSAPLGLTLAGTVAGTTVTTLKPIVLGQDLAPPQAGEIRIETPDLTPFLSLAGSATAIPGPLPADLTASLSANGSDARASLAGRIAGAAISARLDRSSGGEIAGSATLGRLSLPWLAAALVVPQGPGITAGRGTPTDAASVRFGPAPPVRPRIDLDLRVDALDLGRGFMATRTAFGLRFGDGALSLRDVSGDLADGRLTGSLTLSRQGGAAAVAGEATLSDATISELIGEGPISGRLAATLRFGASGESPAALVNNLGGSGEIGLAGLSLPGTDPGALDRALSRALADDDPLREGRLQGLVAEEFAAAPLTAPEPVTAPATIVAGSLRAGPFDLDLGGPRWAGTLGVDLRTGRLDARGTLMSGTAPKGWTGGTPSVQLGLAGTLTKPERNLDTGPLANGLAAVVLQRELEKIELFDADQTERLRRRARIEMDRARAVALKAATDKAAADKAAADKAAAEDAARQARLRAQQAMAEEAARQARARDAEDAARRIRTEPPGAVPGSAGQPLDIRPPSAQP